jgi:hypothetical protein
MIEDQIPYKLENSAVDLARTKPDDDNTEVRGNKRSCPTINHGVNGAQIVLDHRVSS